MVVTILEEGLKSAAQSVAGAVLNHLDSKQDSAVSALDMMKDSLDINLQRDGDRLLKASGEMTVTAATLGGMIGRLNTAIGKFEAAEGRFTRLAKAERIIRAPSITSSRPTSKRTRDEVMFILLPVVLLCLVTYLSNDLLPLHRRRATSTTLLNFLPLNEPK